MPLEWRYSIAEALKHASSAMLGVYNIHVERFRQQGYDRADYRHLLPILQQPAAYVHGACLLAKSRYTRGMKPRHLACAFLLLAAAAQLSAQNTTNAANAKGAVINESEEVQAFRKAAEQGEALAQYYLGIFYHSGQGVAKNEVEAVKWFRKAAEQGESAAQNMLGMMYARGLGVSQDYAEALQWYRKSAAQGDKMGQASLGYMYEGGEGAAQDYVEAYRWFSLSAAQGYSNAQESRDLVAGIMTPDQIAEAQRLARGFKPRKESNSGDSSSAENPKASGTGFFITKDGFVVTNNHVVEGANQVRLVTSAGLISAKVVKVDAADDLALLKTEGLFAALPVAASRAVKLGSTVATVGFPNIGLQGFAPKLSKGEIASLSGAGDDARYFQISVPVQPGNSGGALVDERGNVVGVVAAKLSASAVLKATGALPENMNYAVKSSYLLSFLESVPEVSAKLKEPNTKEVKFEDVVKSAEQAAVLMLVH